MNPNGFWQIALLFVLLCLSAFFSAAETALLSLSKIRIRYMLEEKIKGSETIGKLINNPNKLLSTILVGNNIVNIGASALATSLAIHYFKHRGVGIATGVMTFLVLIFGEITPKSLAAQNSEKISLRVAKPIYFLTIILNPIIIILMKVTNIFIRFLGGGIEKQRPFITEEEFKTIVDVSHEEGVLEGEEKQMIYNVFDFGDSQAKDIMIPRTDMIAANIESSYRDILKLFKEEQFSRIPIYQNNYDHIVGILYIKDLIFFEGAEESFHIRDYMRPPFFTYEFKQTAALFAEMRTKRIAMAIVLDEYGGTAGIVTIEDLVEEIVGDIRDEYDKEKDEIEVIKEDEYLVSGSVKIDTINEMIGTHIESEDFDSIGGFIIGALGRLPEVGETLEQNHIQFIVEKIDKNRIEKLRILT